MPFNHIQGVKLVIFIFQQLHYELFKILIGFDYFVPFLYETYTNVVAIIFTYNIFK